MSFDPQSYRQAKLGDFNGISDRIWPTPVWLLHQGTDVLVYRNADAARGISRAQHRMFAHLARFGEHPDSPGNITTLVATGLPNLVLDRQIAIFDHMATDQKLRLARDGEIEEFIAAWFRVREGR